MAESGIHYDDDGFFARKIEKRVTDIDQGVEEILKLLKGELEDTLNKIKATPLQVALHPKQAKSIEQLVDLAIKQQRSQRTSHGNSPRSQNNSTDRTQDTSSRRGGTQSRTHANGSRSSNSSPSDQSSSGRSRDANGRFSSTGADTPKSSTDQQGRNSKGQFVAGKPSTISTIEDIFTKLNRSLPSVSQNGVDPTIDAINELGSIVSPVGKMAGMIFKPLSGLAKLKKRSEPIPKEEVDHNRKQLRLLQFIGDGLGKLKQNRMMGGFMGGFGKLLKGKGVPILGSLLAMMSLSNWDEQSTTEKGGTVGTIGGGVIGGAVGSLLGPVGTVIGAGIGAWVGDELGKEVAPYFEKWTSQLQVSNLPKQIISEWKSLISDLWKAFKQQLANLVPDVPEPIKEGANNVTQWIKEKATKLAEFVGIPMAATATDESAPGAGSSVTSGSATDPRVVAVTGNTGRGTGAHLDIRYPTAYAKANGLIDANGKRMPVDDELMSRFVMNGKPLSKKDSNSQHGWRTLGGKKEFHQGHDFRASIGTPVTTTHPVKDVRKFWDDKGGGWVSNVTFEDGKQVNLLHQDKSFQERVATGSTKAQATASNNTKATPQTTGNSIRRVLKVGAGFNVVEMADGSQVEQTGNWNWRNNNPGNIEFGDLAKKYGAIQPDEVLPTKKGRPRADRFAVFPTYEAGKKAKSELLFESNRARELETKADYGKGLGYKDKTLRQAIASWAPPEDNNDTAKYQARVLASVGNQNKKMRDYTEKERQAILNAMQQMEGHNNVKSRVLKAPAKASQQIKSKAEDMVRSASNFTSAQQPTALQQEPLPRVVNHKNTPIEVAQQRTTTNSTPKVIAPSAMPSDNIGQNVGDRMLAHAITGGIGGISWEKG